MTTDDPFKRLKAEAGKNPASITTGAQVDGELISPAPADAPPAMRKHRAHGEAAAIWTYRDAAGAVLGHVARFDKADGEKAILPQTFRRDPRGLGWRWKGWADARPLYGLDRLAARPDAPVLIVEGEKTADAAARLFPDLVCMAWQGGSNATAKADWAPLAGRVAVILPDADEPGLKAAKAVRGALVKLGVRLASVIYLPAGLPKGWDVADEFPAGFTLEALRALVDAALNPPADAATTSGPDDSGWPARFMMNGGGLYFQPPGDDKAPQWVCGPFDVLGEARDPEGSGWAVVIRFKDRDGREKTAILPKSKLGTASTELRAHLMDLGLEMPRRSPNSGDPLADCLLKIRSDRRIVLCGTTGWAVASFVLPGEVIAGAEAEPAMFTGEAKALHFGRRGDMAAWQSEIAARAVGNSRAMFCLSLAFAGPLLKVLNLESGGFHIRGSSSSGKSTLAMVAGSVWGGGGPLGHAQSWRATANGLETIASGHNDAFLALDELAQLAPDEAGTAAYMLSNGQAKARLKSDGSARARAHWRVVFLSTGEISLAAHMQAAKSGASAMAGQELRVIDLKADAGQGLGAWEDINGFTTGAEFSDALKLAAKMNYGHAGPAFVRALIDGGGDVIAQAKAVEARFLKMALREGDTGQIHRGACRFALAAVAGELAASLGIVPWAPDAALGVALFMFAEWASGFGRTTAREETAVLRRVVDMIQANMARFGAAGDDDFEVDGKGPRAGESRSLTSLGIFGSQKIGGASEDCYLFHSGGWAETFRAMDPQFAAKVLKGRDYLITDGDGRLQKKKKIKGQTTNMYWLRASVLGHDFEARDA